MGPGWARQEGGAGSPGCSTGAARSRPRTCTGAQAQAVQLVMPGCAEAPEAQPRPPNSLLSLLSLLWERPESGGAQVSLGRGPGPREGLRPCGGWEDDCEATVGSQPGPLHQGGSPPLQRPSQKGIPLLAVPRCPPRRPLPQFVFGREDIWRCPSLPSHHGLASAPNGSSRVTQLAAGLGLELSVPDSGTSPTCKSPYFLSFAMSVWVP